MARCTKTQDSTFQSLLTAAAAIPLVSTASSAQTISEKTTFRFQYSYYEDWQQGNQDRMKVHAPMIWFHTPIGDSTEIEGGFVLDAMSGASPLFHDTLTGASGIGIDDDRTSGDLKITEYFENFNISIGGVYSSEDDYDSQGGSVSTQIWTPDKNTVFLIGFDANHDRVRSTNDSSIDELKRNLGGIIGVTQVLDKNSIIQSNISYSGQHGYLSDPYKTADNRPRSRNRFAWLTRYVRYIESAQASFHLDYRYYLDSWSIYSHMLEMMWYQPLDQEEKWMLRPRFRYYSQRKAEFYNRLEPTEFFGEGPYTADQRLSGFGSIGGGLKLIHDFGRGFSTSISYDFILNDSGIAIGSPGSPDIQDIYMHYFSFGFAKTF